jgi:hypothetical protein
MMQFKAWPTTSGERGPGKRPRRRPMCEDLEGRVLLATAGTDYIATGFRWTNPSHVTYSIAPDGVYWDHGVNNLNATFDAKFGNGVWQVQLARALATWASVANINITQVADSGQALGAQSISQANPQFGEIRFGGYTFADNTTLAQSYFPPPGGGADAGGVEVNTSMGWNIGSDFDLYSVMLHETGLTLGLGEPPNTSVVMSTVYGGVRPGLTPDDIAGIQAIYGPRTQDVYQSQGQGLSPAGAIDVTSQLSGGQATVTGTSLATVGDTEYFTVVAPAGSNERLTVTAAAADVSMLSPKISLYDGSGAVIGSQSNPSSWGDNVSAQASQVTPGQRFTIAVTGATNDVFAVGAYQLQISFSGAAATPSPTPTPSLPPSPIPTVGPSSPTPTPTPTPASSKRPASSGPSGHSAPINILAAATPLGVVTRTTTLTNLSLASSRSIDDFVFENGVAGSYQVTAAGTYISVLAANGRRIASGAGTVTFHVSQPMQTLYLTVTPRGGAPIANFTMTVAARTPRPSLPRPLAWPTRHAQTVARVSSPSHRVH